MTFDALRAGLRSMDGKPLALSSPTVLSVIAELRREDVSDSRLKTIARAPSRYAATSSRPILLPGDQPGKSTAILSMKGVALYDLDFQPYCFSSALLARSLNQLTADPSVANILIEIDTPGGHVTGTQEAADAVWAARKKKPVIGIVNPLCASAGYWIASQCTKIIAVPSADIGSIGVFMTHIDLSEMYAAAGVRPTLIYAGENKVEGNALQPLGEKARAWFQTEVDQTYSDFLAAVARGRGTSSTTVRASFGGGRCFSAMQSQAVGMIDAIASTPDEAFKRARSDVVGARYHALISTAQSEGERPSSRHRAIIEAAARENPRAGDRYREILRREMLK